MAIRAQLFDGTILEFPDGTDQAVIDRVAQEETQARQPKQPAPEGGFFPAVKRGFLQTGMLVGDVLPALVGKAVGAEDYAKRQWEEAAETQKRIEREVPAAVASYKDISGFGDAWMYAKEAVGESLASIIPTLVTGGVGGLIARPAVAAANAAAREAAEKTLMSAAMKMGPPTEIALQKAKEAAVQAGIDAAKKTAFRYEVAGGFAGSAIQNVPEVYQNIKEETGKEDIPAALVAGGFNAALDTILPAQLLKKIRGQGLSETEVMAAWYKRGAKGLGKGFAIEGATEAVQESSSILAENFVAENSDVFNSKNLERVINAGLKGGLGGGVITAAADVATGSAPPQEQTDRQKIEQLQREILGDVDAARAQADLEAAENAKEAAQKAEEARLEAERAPTVAEIFTMASGENGYGALEAEKQRLLAQKKKTKEVKDAIEIIKETQERLTIESYERRAPAAQAVMDDETIRSLGFVKSDKEKSVYRQLLGKSAADPEVTDFLSNYAATKARPQTKSRIEKFLGQIERSQIPLTAEEVAKGEERAGQAVAEPSGAGAAVAGEPSAGVPAAGVGVPEPSGVVPAVADVGEPATGEGPQPAPVATPKPAAEIQEAPKTERDAVKQHAVKGLPIFEAPVSQITLSNDVPQFKSEADEQGIVKRLEGKFERTGVAPIQLWERNDGRLEVISGRHRFDLAKRSGEETIPAQVHKESEGFDANKAARLDAELNIRDEQGEVKDYVVYFERSGITQEEAKSRGLLGRSVGQRGWSIASKGGPDLILAHRSGRLSDEVAAGIAEIAPGDPRLQAVGLNAAIQGRKNVADTLNTVQAVKTLAKERGATEDTSGDLFGFDDSAIKQAEEMARVATEKQQEISSRLNAITGAAKKPEVAKREGIDIKDPEALNKRIKELRQKKAEWSNWSSSPALVNEIKEAISAKATLAEAPKLKPVKLSKETQAKIDELGKLLQKMLGKMGLKNVALNIVQDLENNGEYANRLIKLALDATNPVRDLRHEGLHAMKEMGFFSDAQWKTLSKMARDKWIDKYLKSSRTTYNGQEMSRYDAYMKLYNGNEEAVIEEAIADAFGSFDATKAPPGFQQAILFRMREFFRNLKSALGLANIDSAEDIFRRVEKGELKETAPAVEAPARASLRAPETEAFKRWFGDSKVVDAEGKPLVVYHGSDAKFDVFDTEEGAFFFGGKGAESFAGTYGDNVTPAYLSIKKPFRGSYEDLAGADFDALAKKGYDGAVFVDKESGLQQWVAFNPKQIKRADGATVPARASLRAPETEAFKRWFGDSKIVDAEGKPLALYRGVHGFDSIPEEALNAKAREGYATFASNNPAISNTYANPNWGRFGDRRETGALVPVYVKANRVIEFPTRTNSEGWRTFDKFEFDRRAKTLRRGEVLVVRGVTDTGPRSNLEVDPGRGWSYPSDIYAWGPGTSVKSATGNIGTYDVTKPDIRYSLREVPLSTRGLMEVQPIVAMQELGLKTDAVRKPGGIELFNDVRSIALALNQETIRNHGQIAKTDTSLTSEKELARAMVDEIGYQLRATADTGTGWYSDNYPKAVKKLGKLFPELETNPYARTVFSALVAITSNGEKVSLNVKNAIKLYEDIRMGKDPSNIGSRRKTTLDNNIAVVLRLMQQYGPADMRNELLREITVRDMNAILRSRGEEPDTSYPANTRVPAAALYFGPKLGAFFSNLEGAEGYLTMDMWWTRTVNRMRGQLMSRATEASIKKFANMMGKPDATRDEVVAATIPFRNKYEEFGWHTELEELVGSKEPAKNKDKPAWTAKAKRKTGPAYQGLLFEHRLEKMANTIYKNEYEMLEEAPFTGKDREFMLRTARRAQSLLKAEGINLSLADIQAALWYYEKRLYQHLSGRKADDIGYDEAITQLARESTGPARPSVVFAGQPVPGAGPTGTGAAATGVGGKPAKPSLRDQIPNSIFQRIDQTTVPREEKTFVQRINEAISPKGFSTFRQQLLNRYEGLSRLDRKKIEMMGGAELMADSGAESAALLSDMGSGITASALGVHDRKGGAPVYKRYFVVEVNNRALAKKYNTRAQAEAAAASVNGQVRERGFTTVSNFNESVKGPVAIFAPLMAKYKDSDIFRAFQFYSAVKRGARFMFTTDANGNVVEKLFEPADIQKSKELERMYPEFKEVHADWIKYNDKLVDFMRDTGILSEQNAQTFKMHGDYFPFYRQLDDDEDAVGPRIFQSIAAVKPPKKLKGSESALGDFLENIVRNTQSAVQAGIKNVASRRAAELGMDVGVVSEIKQGVTPDAVNSFYVLENGLKKYYDTSDHLLINSIKSLNLPDMPFIGMLAGPANLLRNLVTKDPGFILANLMRDSMSAWTTSGVKMTPIVDTMRNFGKALASKESPEFEALLNAGVIGGYEFSQNVQQSGKTFGAAIRKAAGVPTTAEQIAKPFTSLWEALEKGTTASDAATRMEIYKKTLEETGNEAEAIYRALEVMNFNRKGSSAVIRILTAAIPFLNARMQGLDILYRAAIAPTVRGDQSERARQVQKTFFVRGAMIMALSSMYWLLTNDDEEYKKQEQETRDNYWLLPSLGVKIPIPFEVGVLFKVIPERILAYTLGDDTGKDFLNSMRRQLLSTLAFNPIPQTALPIIETATNFSFFTQRPIIPAGLENVAPEYQIGPGTSKIAEAIGKSIGASPMKIDQLINGYTGTMGMYAVDLMDAIYNTMADSPKPSKRFEQLPVFRRFLVDPEARGTVTAYYDLKNTVDQVVRTENLLEKTMDYEGYGTYMQENMKLLAAKDYVSDMEKKLKEVREMKMSVRSSTMSADEKRDSIKTLGQYENQLTFNIQELKKIFQ